MVYDMLNLFFLLHRKLNLVPKFRGDIHITIFTFMEKGMHHSFTLLSILLNTWLSNVH